MFLVHEANVLTGVYATVGLEGLRYQFVACSKRSALLRQEWQRVDGRWIQYGVYVVCSFEALFVNGGGFEMDAAARSKLVGLGSLGEMWPLRFGGSQGVGGGC